MRDLTARRIAAQSKTTNPIPWSSFTTPFYIAHRGDTLLAPEDTFAGFNLARNWRYPIKTDAHITADGALVICHDDTVDRTTNGSGTISNMLLSDIIRLDAGSKFSAAYANEHMPTVTELLQKFAGYPVIIDAKTTATATPLATLIKNNNLQPYVMVEGSNFSIIDAVHAVDPSITTVITCFNNTSLTTIVSDMQAHNTLWAAIEIDIPNNNLSQSVIDSLHAAGLKAMAWTLRNRYRLSMAQSYGFDAYVCEDVPYVSSLYTLPSLPFSDSFNRDYLGSGYEQLPIGSSDVVFTIFSADSAVGRKSYNSAAEQWLTVKKLNCPSSITINVTITPQSLNADTTRYAGLQFCTVVDEAVMNFSNGPVGTGGYVFLIRQNGTMEIDKYVGGQTYSVLSTLTSTGNMVVGTGIPVQIVVNSSSIKCTRTDTSQSITVTDTTFRGGHIAFTNAGMASEFSAFSVTSP